MKPIIIALVMTIATNAHATLTTSSSSSQSINNANRTLQIYPFIQTCDETQEPCEKQVIRELSESSKFILYQSDSFKSEPIANAIIEASNQKHMITELIFYYNKFEKLFTSAWLVNKPKIIRYANMYEKLKYNKTIIIDGTTLILNSGNNYVFVKNNPKEINKYIRNVLQYRGRSSVIK